jgi:hypothetical protein
MRRKNYCVSEGLSTDNRVGGQRPTICRAAHTPPPSLIGSVSLEDESICRLRNSQIADRISEIENRRSKLEKRNEQITNRRSKCERRQSPVGPMNRWHDNPIAHGPAIPCPRAARRGKLGMVRNHHKRFSPATMSPGRVGRSVQRTA